MLRHTFCSHLAMRSAPARAIQELAGHRDLTTTRRLMHLGAATLDSAIRLLEPDDRRGNNVATGPDAVSKVCGWSRLGGEPNSASWNQMAPWLRRLEDLRWRPESP